MITLPNKLGLSQWLESLGWVFRVRDGEIIAFRTPNGVENDEEVLIAICEAYDPLPKLKQKKILEIKLQGLVFVQQIFPAISDLEELRLISNIMQSIAPAARQLTQPMQRVVAIWQIAQDCIEEVNASGDEASVEAVIPAWP